MQQWGGQGQQWGGGGGGGKVDGIGAPGNWNCPDCGNENWPNRQACNRCQRPRGQAPSAAQKLTRPADVAPSKVPAGPNGESSLSFLQMICEHNQWPPPQFTMFQHVSEESGTILHCAYTQRGPARRGCDFP